MSSPVSQQTKTMISKPPPLIFEKLGCYFFLGKRPKKPYIKVKIFNIIFWIENDPPPFLEVFQKINPF